MSFPVADAIGYLTNGYRGSTEIYETVTTKQFVNFVVMFSYSTGYENVTTKSQSTSQQGKQQFRYIYTVNHEENLM